MPQEGSGSPPPETFAEAGAAVVVADRNRQLLAEAAEGLRSAGRRVTPVTCNVTDRTEVKAMIAQAVAAHGRPPRDHRTGGRRILLPAAGGKPSRKTTQGTTFVA